MQNQKITYQYLNSLFSYPVSEWNRYLEDEPEVNILAALTELINALIRSSDQNPTFKTEIGETLWKGLIVNAPSHYSTYQLNRSLDKASAEEIIRATMKLKLIDLILKFIKKHSDWKFGQDNREALTNEGKKLQNQIQAYVANPLLKQPTAKEISLLNKVWKKIDNGVQGVVMPIVLVGSTLLFLFLLKLSVDEYYDPNWESLPRPKLTSGSPAAAFINSRPPGRIFFAAVMALVFGVVTILQIRGFRAERRRAQEKDDIEAQLNRPALEQPENSADHRERFNNLFCKRLDIGEPHSTSTISSSSAVTESSEADSLEASNGNLSWGLSYRLTSSEHTVSQTEETNTEEKEEKEEKTEEKVEQTEEKVETKKSI